MSQILCAGAKTRLKGLSCSSEPSIQYRRVYGLVARVANVAESSHLCRKHRYEFSKFEFCCCPSSQWEHKPQTLHPCPQRLLPLFDALGDGNPLYRPGTKICKACIEKCWQSVWQPSHPKSRKIIIKFCVQIIHINTSNFEFRTIGWNTMYTQFFLEKIM